MHRTDVSRQSIPARDAPLVVLPPASACSVGAVRQQRDGLLERPGTHRGLEKGGLRHDDPADEQETVDEQEGVG